MPYTSVTVSGIALLCFPPFDRVFAEHARRSVTEGASDPAALEAKLREVYPRAVVRARDDLASFVGQAWYAYRDGRYSPFVRRPWWESPTAARTVIDAEGRYVDANDAALELLGVTPEELRASEAGDFTFGEHRALVPWVMQLLRDTGELHSTSVVRPKDGGPDVPVEFHIVLAPDGSGTVIAYLRPIPPEAVPVGAPDAREGA